MSSACSATPVQEPPSSGPLRLETVDVTVANLVESGGLAVSLVGHPGSAPPNSTIRVTDLDSSSPSTLATAMADGSFEMTFIAQEHAELRFQTILSGQHSEPVDRRLVEGALAPVERSRCIRVTPGLDIKVDRGAAVVLELANECTGPADLSSPTWRLGLPQFAASIIPGADGLIPSTLAPGQTASISVTFNAANSSAGEYEDVVFLNITMVDEAHGVEVPERHPVSVWSSVSPNSQP